MVIHRPLGIDILQKLHSCDSFVLHFTEIQQMLNEPPKFAQVVSGPVYPYSAESWPKTPFISLIHFIENLILQSSDLRVFPH